MNTGLFGSPVPLLNLLAIGGQEIVVILLALLGMALFFVPLILTLINCLKSDFKDPQMKAIWVGLMVFLFPLGMVVYWFIAPGQKALGGPSR
jgi:Phospholipase_D-nuclease N-terminal